MKPEFQSFFCFLSLFPLLSCMEEKEREIRYQELIEKYHLLDLQENEDTVTDKLLLKWLEDIRIDFGLSEQEISGELLETNYVGFNGLLCKGTRKEYLLKTIKQQEDLAHTLTGHAYNEKVSEIVHAKKVNSECYKIHAMPGSVREYNGMLRSIIYCLCNDYKFQEAVSGFKAQPFIYFSLSQEVLQELLEAKSASGGIMPIIVMYPSNGKEHAQYILTTLYEEFKRMQGLGFTPRFSKQIIPPLSYTQGNGDEKPEFPSFFTKNKVFYNRGFTGLKKRDFKLMNPEYKH